MAPHWRVREGFVEKQMSKLDLGDWVELVKGQAPEGGNWREEGT